MRVLVDARISPGTMGGVEQVIKGLARGFVEIGQLTEVTFLTTTDDDWLRDCLDGNGIAHARRAARSLPAAVDALRRRSLDKVPALRRLPRIGSPIPRGTALVKVGRPDAVHFLTQQGFSTGAPSLYSPYDLLHLHHPEYFTPSEVARRERVYHALCRQAHVVMAMTSWIRDDLVERYGLEPNRVRIVPLGASFGPTPDVSLTDIQSRYRLPGRFALYPAHTWPHKNHMRLLQALALLRDNDRLTVPLVCTGYEDSFADTIRDARDRLQLGGQVHFLGRVSAADVRALYRLAHCLVFPSVFEGWGMPVFEAFASGLPVACSTATSLPEQTRGGALLYDPLDVDAMAAGIASVWQDEALRHHLISVGLQRVRTLTWRRTAMAHCALYREVADLPLDELDRKLVTASGDGSVEQVPLPNSEGNQATRTA